MTCGSSVLPFPSSALGSDRVGGERDDLVTRPFSAKNVTDCSNLDQFRAYRAEHDSPGLTPPFFVDWLTISQVHAVELPRIDAGCVYATDGDGVEEWRTTRAVRHQGSHETSIGVRCDGSRVIVSGNLSRFGRPDNLFGFGFFDALAVANRICAHYGLPEFTAGARGEVSRPAGVSHIWTGARVSRIDLTANYETGSADNAHALMQWLGSQHSPRQAGRVLGAGETVDFGAGSRRQYWKAYIKHIEMEKRGVADPRVVDWCRDHGIVRFEGTIKSNALTDLGCAFLGDYETGWAMGELVKLFEEKREIFTRAQRSTDDLDELPRALRGTARDYLAGSDCVRLLGRRTFYRHRAALLPYGIDISKRNVLPFAPRIRVIECRPAVVPEWYSFSAEG